MSAPPLRQTRWRLALLFSGGLAAIAGFCVWSAYQAIASAYRRSLDRELHSVAITLHNSVEPLLREPGKFSLPARRLLPDLCLAGTDCQLGRHPDRHIHGALSPERYYVCFFNLDRELVGFVGQPPSHDSQSNDLPQWTTKRAADGHYYRQISFHLHTRQYDHWGYFQVGRSLDEFELALVQARQILLLGTVLGLLAIALLGWWLAGLAISPLERSYHQMQRFTSDAAHELRTPLAALRATVEMTLTQPQLTARELKPNLQAIHRQTHQLTRLVTDLLVLSRLDRQPLQVQPRVAIDLNDLASDLAEEFAALALKRRLKLHAFPLLDYSPVVQGNPDQLYRLVSNLLSNALAYTPAGGRVEIGINCLSSSQQVGLYVRDTGVGIASAEQAKIFNRFYRTGNQPEQTAGGFGLGLAIARAIARAHQGTLGVESEVGRGSCFMLRLPLHASRSYALP